MAACSTQEQSACGETKRAASCEALSRAFAMRLELVARQSQGFVDPLLPCWRSPPPDGPIRLQEGGTSLVSNASSGWAHALLDRWFTDGVTSVMLKVEEAAADLFIGVVSANFLPGAPDFNLPLSESRHAVVAHASTGKVYHKGSPTLLALPLPIKEAARLRRQRQEQMASPAALAPETCTGTQPS